MDVGNPINPAIDMVQHQVASANMQGTHEVDCRAARKRQGMRSNLVINSTTASPCAGGGRFVQGMGWTCIEELQWADKQHSGIRPGQFSHTDRGHARWDPLHVIHPPLLILLSISTGAAPYLLHRPAGVCMISLARASPLAIAVMTQRLAHIPAPRGLPV